MEEVEVVRRGLKSCTSCTATYSPYQAGETESDYYGYWCCLDFGYPRSGLCGLCNPRSIFYLDPTKCYSLYDDGCGKEHAAERKHVITQ